MITEAIKEREQFIISKNSMIITSDSRIVETLNSSSMLSSMNIYIMIKYLKRGEVICFSEM